MASFDFMSCRIDVADRGTSLDLAAMPGNADMTMSFAHEYVHYLQLISSNAGFRILAELLAFGVQSALQLAGLVGPDGGLVTGYHQILPKLAALPDHEGLKHPDIHARAQEFSDEIQVQFQPRSYPYSGNKNPWEIDEQIISYGTYTEPMVGFVLAGPRFRPFTPGLLAEGMARCIDQWLKRNMGYSNHSWGSSQIETEYYNGLRHLLANQRYEHNIAPETLDRVSVIMCSLALCDAATRSRSLPDATTIARQPQRGRDRRNSRASPARRSGSKRSLAR